MMATRFEAGALGVLIGSLPVSAHKEAHRLVMKYTPDIPLWSQLPAYKKEEGMMFQFLPGMPGLSIEADNFFIDDSQPDFNDELLKFYEEYMAVSEGRMPLSDSRFILTPDTAEGFFVFMENIRQLSEPPIALKGQITGPITLTTGIKDQHKQAIFYNEQLRDAAVKLIAMKAAWQIRRMSAIKRPAIVFFDEPGLAGFGSSEFISISSADVAACFKEVIDAVHHQGGLAGIHVCANADWTLLLDSDVDILSFDAYCFFDKLMLYPEHLKRFIESGRIVAWGIVPTSSLADIEKETTDSLMIRWEQMITALSGIGIDKLTLIRQSLITPSCGTGSLPLTHAMKVLELTTSLSERIRK
jgi:hypothetical protein